MTTAETIFSSMTAAFAVINFGLYIIQNVLIGRYKVLLDEVLKYCLIQILKQAIEKEDYETAERCKSPLSNIAELKNAKK